jgi:hypothetical protein
MVADDVSRIEVSLQTHDLGHERLQLLKVCVLTISLQGSNKSPVVSLIAGGLAGGVEATITYRKSNKAVVLVDIEEACHEKREPHPDAREPLPSCKLTIPFLLHSIRIRQNKSPTARHISNT